MNITGRLWLAALAGLVLVACNPASDREAQVVDPADYSAFYLWSGVEPVPQMQGADAVYVLWGELRLDEPDRIVPILRTVPSGEAKELWLVVRAERIGWGEGAYRQLLETAGIWNRDGLLTGVQVDFDSSTGRLDGYAAFLADLRQRLPRGLQLSATGLMDWPANASDDDLSAMAGALDEIVVQTYQDRTTLPGYQRYLSATERLPLPYRVALVEGGEWDPPAHLPDDPRFKGYVVFLLAGAPRQKP
ncbi:DUF3142 domain-containing protein [Parerythrobacter aestuarii]|uniref:DUF3142 domain-containing protein n=1 Tax=Parerythrobacter aestuarii TaxID=3020909 RepID=UPI0024DECF1A|nr:DUF3142 domain-containing protein [Parerythrobacter aestuarii]